MAQGFTTIRDNLVGINGIAPSVGNGISGTGVLRVAIASDNTAFSVNATLAAETTKVIGTVRTLGNVGAIFDGVNTAATAPANGILGLGIYNSTEPSPSTGQSVGIQLDSKGRQRTVLMDAAGNTRGANIDSSNRLSVTIDNIASSLTLGTVTTVGTVTTITNTVTVAGAKTNNNAAPGGTNVGALVGIANAAQQTWTEGNEVLLSTNLKGSVRSIIQDAALNDRGANVNSSNQLLTSDDLATIAGTATVTAGVNGLLAVGGNVASAGTDSGNPVKIGAIAHTAAPTATTDGKRIDVIADKVGKLVAVQAVRDLLAIQTTTITSSTSETTIVTAGSSGVFNDICYITVANTSATGTKVTLKDATSGTTRAIWYIPPTETRGLALSAGSPMVQASAANNWTLTCGTSVASIEVCVGYVKNI